MRQQLLPLTAGDIRVLPERVLAPQRRLANIGRCCADGRCSVYPSNKLIWATYSSTDFFVHGSAGEPTTPFGLSKPSRRVGTGERGPIRF